MEPILVNEKPRWVEATQDEWADFVSLFPGSYGTGQGNSDMIHKSADGVAIGWVVYHDSIHKTYKINKGATPPPKGVK